MKIKIVISCLIAACLGCGSKVLADSQAKCQSDYITAAPEFRVAAPYNTCVKKINNPNIQYKGWNSCYASVLKGDKKCIVHWTINSPTNSWKLTDANGCLR